LRGEKMANETRCPACRRGRLTRSTANHTVKIGDVEVVFREVPVSRCSSCKETIFDGPFMERVELYAADELARSGAVSPDGFKFMRKALGLRAEDLGEMLDVSNETVSRWETGRNPITRSALAVLGALIEDQIAGRETMSELLEALKKPDASRRIVARAVPVEPEIRAEG
jgi:putative zinc finger/helix-turn-helix YgiT family protein